MQEVKFNNHEIQQFIAASLVIGFVFSFGAQANLLSWLKEFILATLLGGFALYIKVLGQKYAAVSNGAEAKFELWTISRFWFNKASVLKKPVTQFSKVFYNFTFILFSFWLILPVLLVFLSNGNIHFLAVSTLAVGVTAAHRLGKKYIQPSEAEIAKIALVGPVLNILFALIVKTLFGLSGIAGLFVSINIALAISNMIPLPKLDGGLIFFGSKLLYIFSVIFILGCTFLIYFLTIVPAVILSLIFATTILVLYYYFHVFK